MAIKLSSLKANPKNPRRISKDALERLKEKLQRNPEALKVRPIVIENWESRIILAGNQRCKALKALGYKEVPEEYVQSAENWTDDQRREFLVNDNISDGEWEWKQLREDYDEAELAEWGLSDIPEIDEDDGAAAGAKGKESSGEAGLFLKVTCRDENHARKLYEKLKAEKLEVKILLGDKEMQPGDGAYDWALN